MNDTMLNESPFCSCSQNVVRCSQTEIERMLYLWEVREFPLGFDSLIPGYKSPVFTGLL